MTKIYDFKAITGKGKEVDLGQYQGKVLSKEVLSALSGLMDI